jgi:hypothetical protein
MTADRAGRLLTLGDTDRPMHDPPGDIRGRWVIDPNGDEIGHIDALLVDDQAREVRFLRIASSGSPTGGLRKILLPVEAVTDVDDEQVQIDQTGELVAGSPHYDPQGSYDHDYYQALYRYYGFTPYWQQRDS